MERDDGEGDIQGESACPWVCCMPLCLPTSDAAVKSMRACWVQVGLLVGPHQVRKGDRGLVVVGASLEKGDLTSGEGLEGEGGECVRGKERGA